VEGALGVIPRGSANHPRMLFQLNTEKDKDEQKSQEKLKEQQEKEMETKKNANILSKKKQLSMLKTIESVYDLIIQMEDIHYFLPSVEEEEDRYLSSECRNLQPDSIVLIPFSFYFLFLFYFIHSLFSFLFFSF